MLVNSTDRNQFVDFRAAAVNNLDYSVVVIVSIVHCRQFKLLNNRAALNVRSKLFFKCNKADDLALYQKFLQHHSTYFPPSLSLSVF